MWSRLRRRVASSHSTDVQKYTGGTAWHSKATLCGRPGEKPEGRGDRLPRLDREAADRTERQRYVGGY